VFLEVVSEKLCKGVNKLKIIFLIKNIKVIYFSPRIADEEIFDLTNTEKYVILVIFKLLQGGKKYESQK